MDNKKYAEYLQSTEWRRIAQRRMEIDDYTCQLCGSKGTRLNGIEVHHISYKSLYNEENRVYQDLICLCHSCHKGIHKMMERTTSPTGKRGWRDNPAIPQVHIFNLNGYLEYLEKEE